MLRYVLVFIVCCLVPLGAHASEPAAGLREGVLVLRNGGLLCGHVTRVGDLYLLTRGDRSEIRVPVREVEMYCLDMEEVYLRRRSRVLPQDVTGHLDLADWCLRQGLLAAAADEMLTAIALEPQNARIRGLERRLQSAASQPDTTAAPAEPECLSVDLDQLEKITNRLPEGVLAEFTSQVQPLLLNRCGANACHGSASNGDFRLVRPMWTKIISRRFTQRNLYSVLQYVDDADPDASPLLRLPAAAHGGMDTSVFGSREKEQFDLLAAWVRQVAAQAPQTQPAPPKPAPSGLVQASYDQPIQLPQSGDDKRPSPGQPAIPATPLPPGSASNPHYLPRDPFDAEVFNRSHRGP